MAIFRHCQEKKVGASSWLDVSSVLRERMIISFSGWTGGCSPQRSITVENIINCPSSLNRKHVAVPSARKRIQGQLLLRT